MSESFDFRDEPDEAFDRVEERVAPMDKLPLHFDSGACLMVTPANGAVRMFFDDNRVFNRVVVHPGDDTTVPFKLSDVYLCAMVRGGFPLELPERPDETDHEFMDGYLQIGIDKTLSETG